MDRGDLLSHHPQQQGQPRHSDAAEAAAETADYTFVLRLDDRPGAMELIAATFAHRGISLSATLGNDSGLGIDGSAVVLVHFQSTAARKEALKRTLTRLSRVRSLVEHAPDDPAMRRCALVRVTADAGPVLTLGPDVAGLMQFVSRDAASGEETFALLGPTSVIAGMVEQLRAAGQLCSVVHAVLAL